MAKPVFVGVNVAANFVNNVHRGTFRDQTRSRVAFWCGLMRAYGFKDPPKLLPKAELNALHALFAQTGSDGCRFLEFVVKHVPATANPTPSFVLQNFGFYAQKWAASKEDA